MEAPKILLVEDNAVFRRGARSALETHGYAVLEASDGTEALGLARGDPPALLLLDTTLPDFAPTDILRRLRGLPGCDGLPAVAMVGLLARPEEEGLGGAGFDDFLVKPLETAALLEAVAHALAAGGPGRGREGRGRRVLLVDDDPDHLALARIRFTVAGYTVDTAVDGQEALEKARARRPDVIASDVLMPRLDGLGLCMAVRRDPELAAVPVVLFSGNYVEKSDQRLARDAGATAFVVRSGDLRELLARVLEVSGGPAEAPAVPSAAQAAGVEEERRRRALRLLERQATANVALTRRSRLQQARMDILAAVAEGLSGTRDLEGALREGFVAAFDAWGLCPAALYTTERGGLPVFRARSGYGPEAETALEGFFGHREFAARAMEHPGPLVIRGTAGSAGPEADFLEAAGARSALLAPLRSAGEVVGILLLASPRDELDDPEVRTFAGAIAAQLAQAVSMARTVDCLRTGEARYRAIVENANDAFFLLDPAGEVLEVNRRGEELLARPVGEILRHRLRDFAAPDAPDVGWDALEGLPPGKVAHMEAVQVARPDGSSVPADVSASAVRVGGRDLVLAIARDVSRRRALERRLFMAQKMEAIGQLAGGIAHDFNNLLMVVNGYTEILLGRTPEGRPGRRELEEVLGAGQKAAALTSQLLGFSRRQVVRPRVLDLPGAVGELEADLRRLVGPGTALDLFHEPGQLPVKLDPVQLEQILVQLVQNAAEALRRTGGQIRVITGTADLDEAFVGENDGARPGVHAMVSVSDDGPGMDEETLARAFEPFFTTKEPGKGSGLGLAMIYGIVKQNGGFVHIQSSQGKGTTVSVLLPPVATVEAPPARARNGGEPAPRGRQETILVVEDEWAVRSLIHHVLAEAGYTVVEAASGEDALELAGKMGDGVDLLLTDVVMPGMGGREVVRRMRAERPGLRVLYMSGYSYDALSLEDGGAFEAEFLPKPFAPDLLLEKVAAVLGASRAT